MSVAFETVRPDDYLTRLAGSQVGRASKAHVVEQLRLAPGQCVLDLGCGPGADLPALADAVAPGGAVVGVDTDPDALRAARDAVGARPGVDLLEADVAHLPLADASADRVHTDRVLQHVPDVVAVLTEVARVLRPGGLAVFAEPDWDTLVVDHPDADLAARYRAFVVDAVVRNARVGRGLARHATGAGLALERVTAATSVFLDLAEADAVLGFARVTGRAVAAGRLSEAEARTWLDGLRSGPFLASVTLFVTVVRRDG